MALSRVRTCCLLLTAASMLTAGRMLSAQAAPAAGARPASDSVTIGIGTAAVDSFARAFVAVSALRAQLQGELADPAAKKPDRQAALRTKLHTGITAILREHGLGQAEFAALTRRVSTDDALRKSFEEAVARLSAAKGPGDTR